MISAEDSTLAAGIRSFRAAWKSLILTDLAYKVLGFVVLTPLVSMLFRGVLSLSGRTMLADQDILYFLLGPMGWISLIVVGGVWLAIVALEQAALMLIAYRAADSQRTNTLPALYFALGHAWPVLQVTGRMVALVLATAMPFAALAGGVYLLLLTEYDINYYLGEKPPVFWVAAVLVGAILSVGTVILVRMIIAWSLSLPLLLFEKVSHREALRASRDRTTGRRGSIAAWLVGWFVAFTAVGALATSGLAILGRWIVPLATGSLPLLIVVVGAGLLLFGLVHLVLSLLGATTFAVVLVGLYRQAAGDRAVPEQPAIEAPLDAPAASYPSRRNLLLASAIALLLAAIVGVVAVRTVRLKDKTTITAHRGASAVAPENTLAAVEQAILADADWVEIDVQESADGVVLVVHDSDLKKLAGVPLRIWEATADELRAVDIGSPFGPEFAGQQVPTLEEVLAACKGRIRLNIELKYYGHDEGLEQRVVELVEKHEMQSDIVIMSLKYAGIQKIRALRPEWKVGLLSAVAVGDLTSVDADFLAVNVQLASRGFIRSAHRRGKDVYVWTVNDPISMSAMMGRGVDSIITDDPALALSVREFRAAMSPVERLLFELALLFGVKLESDQTLEDV